LFSVIRGTLQAVIRQLHASIHIVAGA